MLQLRRAQTRLFFAFAQHGRLHALAAADAAAHQIIELVGVYCFIRAAPADPKAPFAIATRQPVDVYGAAQQPERAEGGALQCKQSLPFFIAHIEFFITPAAEQPQLVPSGGHVLQGISHFEPASRIKRQRRFAVLLVQRPILAHLRCPFCIKPPQGHAIEQQALPAFARAGKLALHPLP